MQNNEGSIIYHIEEFRKTILKCLYSLAIVLPVCIFFTPKILDIFIKYILNDSGLVLNYFSPIEVFMVQLKTALALDFLFCFPYISKQLWNFILPALYEHEKKIIKKIVVISSLLFITGSIFCIFMILPLIIKFALSFSNENVKAVLGISNIVTLAMWLSIVFGIMFQVPLITYYLIKNEFMQYKTIADKRPYVIVIIFIFAGILTPPDIISQLLLGIPTYMLFECGLLLSKRTIKKKKSI